MGFHIRKLSMQLIKLFSNKKPSVNKIHQLIGYGSLTTISKYFKQWKSLDSMQPTLKLQSQSCFDTTKVTDGKSSVKQKPPVNSTINNKKQNRKVAEINDPIVQSLITGSINLSHDILNSMSEE